MAERIQSPVVILTEQAQWRDCWLQFDKPHRLLVAARPEEVIPRLQEADAALQQGYYLAGYLSYEAALGLDNAFRTSRAYTMPLLWLGVFSEPSRGDVEKLQVSPPSLQWRSELTRDEYRSAISHIRSQIAAGYTYQTNFTFRLQSPYFGDSLDLFYFLYYNQPSPSCAYVDIGDWAICSASPELFFSLDGSTITVRPMKGTMARGRWYEEDERMAKKLRSSEKDRAENLMIVDMVRNDLGRICTIGSVRVPTLFEVERYATLFQMTSSVSGLTAASFSEIIASLFPCASVTGAPKVEAMKIIAGAERSPREVYTGSIGYITPERRARFNVAIRTVIVNKQTRAAECGIGSGIIWDSTAEKEYQECLLKTQFTMDRRKSFQLLETLRWNPETGFALLELHLLRLESSAKFFGFRFDRDLAQLRLEAALHNTNRVPFKIRILVSVFGDIRVCLIPLSSDPIPKWAQVQFAGSPVDRTELMLFHKTTDRGIYNRMLDSAPNCYDLMLWNKDGFVTELTRFNLIACIGGEWKTPRVENGLLRGTLCQRLLAEHLLEEADITKHDIMDSRAIAVINSVRGLLILKSHTIGTWLLEPVAEHCDPELRILFERARLIVTSSSIAIPEGCN